MATIPVPGQPVPVPTKFTISLTENPDVRKPEGSAKPVTATKPRDIVKERQAEFDERVAQLARTADGRALPRLVIQLLDRVEQLERAIEPK